MPIRANLDMIVVIVLSVIVGVTTFAHLETALTRALFGLPFLLACGYAAYTALTYLQPSRNPQPTALFEQALYSLAFTLVLVVLGGIVLNNTSWGIRRESWTLYLVAVTIGASLFVLVRRDGAVFQVRVGSRQLVLLAIYVGMIVLALGLSWLGDKTRPSDGFTMFWTLPDRTQVNQLDIGIDSEEHTAQDYHLSLLVDGTPFGTYPSIELAPGEVWSVTLNLPPQAATVEAQLFRSGDTTTPYRSTHLEWGALQRLENDSDTIPVKSS